MPKKPPALKFIPGKGFEELVKKLNDEFSTLETFLRNRTVESVKKAGRYIHSHILENKDRADYGKYLFPELAKRTGKDESTLRGILRFERVYAIQVVPPELTWEHCRNLMAVKDEAERKNIEKKVARFHWTSAQLREYLSNRRKIEQIRTADGPIPQLKLERGLLYTYQIIEPAAAKIPEGHIFVDCGFNNWESIASAGDDLKPFPTNGDIVESVKNKNGRYSLKNPAALKKTFTPSNPRLNAWWTVTRYGWLLIAGLIPGENRNCACGVLIARKWTPRRARRPSVSSRHA